MTSMTTPPPQPPTTIQYDDSDVDDDEHKDNDEDEDEEDDEDDEDRRFVWTISTTLPSIVFRENFIPFFIIIFDYSSVHCAVWEKD